MSTLAKEAKEYEFRDECAAFPEMTQKQLQALAENIRNNGQEDKIVLHKDGKILDGRNRYKACVLAGIEPRFDNWDGKAGTEADYVRSMNMHRRHMTAGQRACSAVRLLPSPKLSRTLREQLARDYDTSVSYINDAKLLKSKKMLDDVIAGNKTFQAALKEVKPPEEKPVPVCVVRDRLVAIINKSPEALKAFTKSHPGSELDELVAALFGITDADEA